jgi:cytochrome c biogenesis protein CcmG/thiol:disulfide interchange protein DsbE
LGRAKRSVFGHKGSMRTGRFPWLLLLLAFLALGGYAYHRIRERRPQVLVAGDRIVPLQVADLNGSTITLEPPDGRPRIINVFATWCGPCNEEAPGFAAAAKVFARRGISVIGIDQEENAPKVAAFEQEYGLSYPLYIDSTGVSHDVLGARMIPTTIVVDAKGIIRAIHEGPMTRREILGLADGLETRS